MDISELSYYYFLYGGLLLTRWLWIISLYHKCNFVLLSSLMAYHQIFNINNTTGATSWAGIAYTSGAPEFTPFLWSLWFPVFCMMFYVPLFSPFFLAIVLYVLLRVTASDYPLDIFLLTIVWGFLSFFFWPYCVIYTLIYGFRFYHLGSFNIFFKLYM